MGRKKRPYYRIVAVDSKKRRDGSYIEKIGAYDPINKKIDEQLTIDHELALKWLAVGAQPSDSVHSLLKKAGVMLKFDMIKRHKTEKVGDKYKVVKDEAGKPVRKFTDEQVEEAYQNWLKAQEVRLQKQLEKKQNQLSKKAKAKIEAEKKAKEAAAAAPAEEKTEE